MKLIYIHTDTYTIKIIFTHFVTLSLRKVKEIGLIATTRFEDLELNCVVG